MAMGSLTSFVASLALLTTLSVLGRSQDCESQATCGACLATVGCQWCAVVEFDGIRCSTNFTSVLCQDAEMSTGAINNRDLSDPTTNPVSVSNVDITLGVGVPQTFTMSITPLRNLPLDLYVLIDLSGSMIEELRSLRNIAGEIAARIENVTNNVRIGFGSFNDKPTRPYTYFLELDDNGMCPVVDMFSDRCSNYAFRHQITLTDNITLYTERLQGITNTANADLPENGLEALAQVVACEDIIGWRSRQATGRDRGLIRIVLYMTDQGFHYSGEGKLAGILKPYRGECLLDPPQPGQLEVELTKWDEVDYPSVGQIVRMLNDSQVGVIFAIQGPRIQTYANLVRLIETHFRASVAELANEGGNILTLIDEEARRFLQTVTLNPGVSDDLIFNITPSCPAGSDVISTGTSIGCDGVQLENRVDFNVTVTLRNCNNFNTTGSQPRVHPFTSRGFGEFTLTYTGDCVCDCAAEDRITSNAARCSGNGNFTCGVCECNDNFCGATCELKVDTTVCMCDQLTEDCPVNDDGMFCSGQGACCQGDCICRDDENGFPYRHNGQTRDCSCPPAELVCSDFPENPERTCENMGVCGCFACECQSAFTGRFCDTRVLFACNDEMDFTCFEACATANFDEVQCKMCEPTRPLLTFTDSSIPDGVDLRDYLQDLSVQYSNDNSSAFITDCQWVRDTCRYDYFTVRSSSQFVILVLDREPVCTNPNAITLPFPVYVLAFIVIGILIILGVIVFVLIKIIISILDYMEVKRWERETKDADFSKNQNPLYQSPEMKYENVAYGRE